MIQGAISNDGNAELESVMEVVRIGLLLAHREGQVALKLTTAYHSKTKLKVKVDVGRAADCYVTRV